MVGKTINVGVPGETPIKVSYQIVTDFQYYLGLNRRNKVKKGEGGRGSGRGFIIFILL